MLEFDLEVNGQSPASGLCTQPVILPRLASQVLKLEAITALGKLLKWRKSLWPDSFKQGAGYTLRGRAKLQGQDWLPYYFLPYLRYRHLFMRYT